MDHHRALCGFVSLIYRYGGARPPDEVVVGLAPPLPGGAPLAVRVATADDPTPCELASRVEAARRTARPTRGALRFLFLRGGPAPPAPGDGWHLVLDVGDTTGLDRPLLSGSALCGPEAAERAREHFFTLLAACHEAPATPLSRLPLTGEKERARLLAGSRGRPVAAVSSSPEVRLHHRFEAQAAASPAALALAGPGVAMTYGDLSRRANRLARLLREWGIGPGALVGLWMERRPELPLAMLAVLKAGGACLPLDPEHPREHLHRVLHDARPAVVIACDPPEAPDAGPWRVLDLAGCGSLLEAGDGSDLTPLALPEDLAFVLYTSGSTGRPKGVMMTHGGRCRRQLWTQHRYGATPADRHLLKSPIGFGTLIRELFWPLTTGGTAVLAPPGGHRDVPGLVRLMRDQGVTIASFVPSLLREVLEDPGLPDCGALRHVCCTGEALPVELQARFRQRLPQARLHLFYGSTEIPTAACWDFGDGDGEPIVTAGRPTDLDVYVLDRHGEPVPVGVAGEVCIGGDDLARGYLGRPELTAERFAPDPFAPQPGSRRFHTGDLARWRADGRLEYLGRLDRETKVRGSRVDLDEVADLLRRHPQVREAAVLAAAGPGGEVRMTAYYVPAGEPPPPHELRRHLARLAPAAMVPARFAPLPRFPRNVHGKVDRGALASLAPPQPRRGKAPRTATEKTLAAIWQEVAGLPEPGRDDHFFVLGGNSLAAMRVRAAVRDRLGVDLDLERFFAAATLREIAAEVERRARQPAEPRTAEPYAESAGRDAAATGPSGRAPLSAAQRRLWYLHLLSPASPVYNVAAAYEIRGPLDARALRRALEALVRRHEGLRSAVIAVDGEPWLSIAPPLPVPLPAVDLAGLPAPRCHEEARRQAAEISRRAFDLSRAPLLAACLLLLGPDRRVLVLVAPHFACDGWSRGNLERELSQAYAAFRQGHEPDFPALPLRCADLAGDEARRRSEPGAAAALRSWMERLRDLPPPLELAGEAPAATAAGGPDYESAGEVLRRLDAGAATALRTMSRQEGATLFTVLLAAFALLLGRLTSRTDLVIGTPVSRRSSRAEDLLVGCLVNTLPLRLDLAGAPSFRDLLQRARSVVSQALAHADVPFDALVEAANPERRPHRNPLFEVALSHVDFRRTALRLAGTEAVRLDLPATGAKFDLGCYVTDDGPELQLRLVYRRALIPPERAAVLLDQYSGLLQQLAQDPGLAVSGLSLVTPATRPFLPDLAEPLAEPAHEPVWARFLRLAALQPAAPALRSGPLVRTYGELAADAGTLVRRLAGLGLQPGDRVAVMGGRLPGLVTACLAVLAAGGVLLLVDESLPAIRRRSMLEQARVRLTLRIGTGAPAAGEEGGATLWIDPVRGLPETDGAAAGDGCGPLPGGDDPACVFFTSGTTGTPKGIVMPHKSVAHFLAWEREALAVTPADRVPLLTSLSFDAVLRDLFLPLASGGTLCIPPAGMDLSPSSVVPWLAAEGVTLVHTVPSLAYTWLVGLVRPVQLPALRWLVLSGEPLTDSLVRRWRAVFPGSGGIVNLYGPTETVMCKCWSVVPGEPAPGVQPVGRPMPQTQALVLTAGGELCGVGEIGEIVLRTPFRSLGTLGPHGLEQGRFVANPRRDDPRDLLYPTGDLGRFRPDGSLEICGRRDRQVKVRGARVELEEVESGLAGLPGVAAAVVEAFEEVGERRLVAYVVPRAGSVLDPAGLAAALRERLPAYMIPAAFVPLDRLPRTASGKVDRAALPPPRPERPTLGAAAFVAPRNPLEFQVAQIWEELLGVRPVGVCDNFFDLGGHSLLAIRMLARIEQSLGAVLRLSDLFPEPTVEHLARRLARREAERPWQPLVPIWPRGPRPPLFCVHPAGGAVLCYVDLARWLGLDQPLYGLQGPDPRGSREPFGSIEEMAACYVAAMRAAQPEGPYFLAGFSFGGLVAFEISQQLHRAGLPVALLALLDTGPPHTGGLYDDASLIHHEISAVLERHDLSDGAADPEDERGLWEDFVQLARRHGAGARREPGRGRRAADLGAVQQLFRTLRLLPTDEGLDYPAIRRYMRFLRANLRAGREYQPRPSPQRITLFRTHERLANAAATPAGSDAWAMLAGGGLDVCAVPGRHLELFIPPAVEVVARHLRACIDLAPPGRRP